MGLQYIIPYTASIDLVIWFMGVEWVFFFIAIPIISFLVRQGKEQYIVAIIDITISIILVLFHRFQIQILLIYPSEKLFFLYRALVLSLFISIGILLYQNINCLLIGGQFILFSFFYSLYCDELSYVSREQYFSWYALYLAIFALVRLLYANTSKEIVSFFAKRSYVIYITHGYMGYVTTVVLTKMGVDTSVIMMLVMVICVIYGCLVWGVLDKIKNTIKQRNKEAKCSEVLG